MKDSDREAEKLIKSIFALKELLATLREAPYAGTILSVKEIYELAIEVFDLLRFLRSQASSPRGRLNPTIKQDPDPIKIVHIPVKNWVDDKGRVQWEHRREMMVNTGGLIRVENREADIPLGISERKFLELVSALLIEEKRRVLNKEPSLRLFFPKFEEEDIAADVHYELSREQVPIFDHQSKQTKHAAKKAYWRRKRFG